MHPPIKEISKIAVLINGIFVASLPVPNAIAKWAALAALAAYIGVLVFVPQPSSTPATKRIYRIVTAAAAIGLIVGILYLILASDRTVTLSDGRVYIEGTTLTQAAQNYIHLHPTITPKEYLADVPGHDPTEVWTPESTVGNLTILAVTYSLFTFSLAFGILGGIQLIPRPDIWFWIILGIAVCTALFIAWLFLSHHLVFQ